MLRVCSHIGHPALLDAADEAGMLIWQDFPLQWLYRREVLPEAERQLDRAMRALYNHPSLAIWCMHNEPIHVTDPRSDTALDRARSYASVFGWSWNREVLDTHLQRVAQRLDPTRPIVRSSGEFGLPLVRSGTDSHFYYGWYPIYGPLHAWEEFIRAFPGSIRFVTEFGAQSFPNVESCVRFMPEALADIDWEELAQHYAFQPEIMARWIDWRAAGSLAELVELTQEYQSRVNRYYIDRLRYHKYRPTGGALAFVLHDAAPAISWSVVDYWRAPKGSYAALRRAFSPQYLFSLIEDANARVGVPLRIPIYVVNDAPREVFADIEARLVGPGGNELAMIAREFTLPADCMAIEIEQLRLTPTVAGEYQLTLVLQSAAGAELVHTYCIAVT
jgi:beta-mannosidase